MSNRIALLVIDVQAGLFKRPTPVYRGEALIATLNTLAARARLAGVPVVYIQHSNPKILVRDSPAWQLHPGLQLQAGDLWVHMTHGNAFQNTNLQRLLNKHQVSSVVVTGLVTHGCVQATCLGGLALGYRVILVMDGHSNYHRQAKTIITEWHAKLGANGVELHLADETHFLPARMVKSGLHYAHHRPRPRSAPPGAGFP